MAAEELCEVLKMLEEQVTRTQNLCLQRRRETECCVRQCRELLKPWPLKSKSEEKDEENPESRKNPSALQDENPPECKASAAETKELAALDDLLAKAQKVREIQLKVDEAAAKANNAPKKKITKKPIPVAGNNSCVKQSTQPSLKKPIPKLSKTASRHPTAMKKPAAQKSAVRSTYSSSYGRPSSAKSLVQSRHSQSSSAKVYLDSVLKDTKGKLLKNVSRTQGADPSSRSGTRLSDSEAQREEISIHREKDSNSYSKDLHHELQPGPLRGNEPVTTVKTLEAFKCADRSTELIRELHESKLQVDVMNPLASHDLSNKFQNTTGKPCKSSGLSNQDGQFTQETSHVHGQKEEWFDPFSKEAELVLPGKYRKLKATSSRLYSELKSVTCKRDEPSPCQHFVNRIECVFDAERIPTHQTLQSNVRGLLEEHEKLTRLTDEAVNRSNNLNENSSWSEVYKCYRRWQVVLSKFNELQRKTQQLLEAEEQLSKRCPCGNCDAFDRVPSRDVTCIRDSWNVRDQGSSREGCILLSSWMPDDIEVNLRDELCGNLIWRYDSVDFSYKSPKELHELIQLHHEVQLLCFKLHISQLADEKLLPLLEKLDPSDSAFVPLHRLMHGLVCGGGKVFPAMVLDNL